MGFKKSALTAKDKKMIRTGYGIGFKESLSIMTKRVEDAKKLVDHKWSLIDRIKAYYQFSDLHECKVRYEALKAQFEDMFHDYVRDNYPYFNKVNNFDVFEKSVDERINRFLMNDK